MKAVGELEGSLLRSVSRSFYLTIRLLPPDLRAPIGLAYLLARASDTIADSATAPAQVRIAHLAAFERMIMDGTPAGLDVLRREVRPENPAEQELIRSLDACIARLGSIDKAARREIRTLMPRIIRGQALDLRRFHLDAKPGELRALKTADELDEYTYLVAGCVGEFWTRLCGLRLRRYSRIDIEELSKIGIDFGKGLQLVNILRDLPADVRLGRCYLPETELQAAGIPLERVRETPASCRPVFDRWQGVAYERLAAGRRYIAAIRPIRIRMACFLPWHLGIGTLNQFQTVHPLESPAPVKVPRSAVRRALVLAPLVGVSSVALALISRPRQPQNA